MKLLIASLVSGSVGAGVFAFWPRRAKRNDFIDALDDGWIELPSEGGVHYSTDQGRTWHRGPYPWDAA